MANTWSVTDDELELAAAVWISNRAAEPDWTMHLFQNDYDPTPGDVLADYEEADFSGYVAQALEMGSWDFVGTVDHVVTTSANFSCQFTADGSLVGEQIVYGYYLTDNSGNYRWGERFEVPRTILANDVLFVNPQMRFANLPAD